MSKPIDMFLTKEAFNEYVKRLKEQQAKQHGMTPEQWDNAILNQLVVTPVLIEHQDEQPCLHKQCSKCLGSGFDLKTGEMCVHHMSCSCPRCTPRI